MITPREIHAKAVRIYPQAARAWLAGDDSFFPRVIPASKSLQGYDTAEAIAAVRRLREASKEVVGHGYTVEWDERRSRKFGQNAFPRRIVMETREDLLKYIGREREFRRFTMAVERLRSEFGERLENWFPSHIAALVGVAKELDGLIEVVQYFLQHPRPQKFARELPIAVDTKFIERHQGILGQWLDRILPPGAIRADERQFARRYGLRDREPFVIVRCLDRTVKQRLGFPWSECALPLATPAAWEIEQAAGMTVFIVENRTTLRTLPPFPGGVAIEGRGAAVAELRDLQWLASIAVYYWGDLDVEGLGILARLRGLFPGVKSVLMDQATLDRYRSHWVPGTDKKVEVPAQLNDAERAAFVQCRDGNVRLEQERIAQSDVEAAWRALQSGSEPPGRLTRL